MSMEPFNIAYHRTFRSGRMTLGLMTPMDRRAGEMADVGFERDAAARADANGIQALWARDVPLAIPQGSDGEAALLDDPFIWLASLAGVTKYAALGTAAVVLSLRHPLHVAKAALTLDRVTGGRFILGLGSGDREAEFAAFGQKASERGEEFRTRWSLVSSALSTSAERRRDLLDATGGFDIEATPSRRVPMLAIGSARQSLQWIATNADGWASYHRDEIRQQGRIGLWHSSLAERANGSSKPFVQSLHLDLLEDPAAPMAPIEQGIQAGRDALVAYLLRIEALGVEHILLHLAKGHRPVVDIVDEIGLSVQPELRAARPLTTLL